jgi:hypothetical protein
MELVSRTGTWSNGVDAETGMHRCSLDSSLLLSRAANSVHLVAPATYLLFGGGVVGARCVRTNPPGCINKIIPATNTPHRRPSFIFSPPVGAIAIDSG